MDDEEFKVQYLNPDGTIADQPPFTSRLVEASLQLSAIGLVPALILLPCIGEGVPPWLHRFGIWDACFITGIFGTFILTVSLGIVVDGWNWHWRYFWIPHIRAVVAAARREALIGAGTCVAMLLLLTGHYSAFVVSLFGTLVLKTLECYDLMEEVK